MNNSRTPAEIIENYAEIGVKKATQSTSKLILLGILAGMLIAFGSAATNTASYGLESPWLIRLVCGLLFPFGLAMVVVLGAELFTGNCLMVISALDRRCRWSQVLRSWAIVYLANLSGALLVAGGCALFGQLNYGNGALALYTMRMAVTKCTIPFANAVVSGFFCNFLVCLGVLMALSAKDTVGRIMGAFLPVCYFVLCGFEHCVANMFYIPAGILAKMVPAYVELAVSSGVHLESLTVGRFLWNNLIPVTIGNLLGGAALGALMWACHLKKR